MTYWNFTVIRTTARFPNKLFTNLSRASWAVSEWNLSGTTCIRHALHGPQLQWKCSDCKTENTLCRSRVIEGSSILWLPTPIQSKAKKNTWLLAGRITLCGFGGFLRPLVNSTIKNKVNSTWVESCCTRLPFIQQRAFSSTSKKLFTRLLVVTTATSEFGRHICQLMKRNLVA